MDIFKKFEKEIQEIVIIHNCTQHYILLGEELSDNFESYLQPIKEFRDAYEHLIRIFSQCLGLTAKTEDYSKEDYIRNNLSKALGHEYRAFFDVADWFAIICRRQIYQIVKSYNYQKLCSIYPKYPIMKRRLYEISEEIANIREAKDISGNIVEQVNRYQYQLVELLGYYRDLINCEL